MAKAKAVVTDPKIVKLMGVMANLVEQQRAVMAEVDALLAGKAGIGDKLKTFYETWGSLWSARYRGREYVFAFAKDAVQLKRLLRMMTLEELVTRAANYIKSDDPYVVQSGHSFNVFIATVNQWAGFLQGGSAVEDAPVGCKHDPPCASDAACTTKKRKELMQRVADAN